MNRCEEIANGLARDWDSRAPYRTLSGPEAPANMAEAYAIQRALQVRLAMRRGPVAGRKIALSSKTMQQMVGIDHPVAGAFFAKDIHDSPATVRRADFRRLGLEYEMAFTLARDVEPSEAPHDAKAVRALIASVHPAFELIEDRDADYAELDILTLVADNAWCGGVILGPAIDTWRDLDLGDLPAVLHQDGAEPEAANTGAADPLGSMAWILNHCAGQDQTVSANEVLITGSVLKTRFADPGDRFRYRIGDAAPVELTIS